MLYGGSVQVLISRTWLALSAAAVEGQQILSPSPRVSQSRKQGQVVVSWYIRIVFWIQKGQSVSVRWCMHPCLMRIASGLWFSPHTNPGLPIEPAAALVVSRTGPNVYMKSWLIYWNIKTLKKKRKNVEKYASILCHGKKKRKEIYRKVLEAPWICSHPVWEYDQDWINGLEFLERRFCLEQWTCDLMWFSVSVVAWDSVASAGWQGRCGYIGVCQSCKVSVWQVIQGCCSHESGFVPPPTQSGLVIRASAQIFEQGICQQCRLDSGTLDTPSALCVLIDHSSWISLLHSQFATRKFENGRDRNKDDYSWKKTT